MALTSTQLDAIHKLAVRSCLVFGALTFGYTTVSVLKGDEEDTGRNPNQDMSSTRNSQTAEGMEDL